jgi:hypothetical protein|tara:strand:- start:20 stop:445 length:426 start_codon:yes stop_codon:yes gene_type:complete
MKRFLVGDVYKKEIRNLKKVDKQISECLKQSKKISRICKSDPSFEGLNVSIENAISSLLFLSDNVIDLLNLIKEFDILYKKIDYKVIYLLLNNKKDIENFNKIKSLRIGSQNLIKKYSKTLHSFGQQIIKKEEEENGRNKA